MEVTRYENFIKIRENLRSYATFLRDRGLFSVVPVGLPAGSVVKNLPAMQETQKMQV